MIVLETIYNLKNCPSCGHRVTIIKMTHDYYHVGCHTVGCPLCHIHSPNLKTIKDAVFFWHCACRYENDRRDNNGRCCNRNSSRP